MYYDINKLTEAIQKHAVYLQTGDTSKRADLSDADLSDADLRGADLRGADLSYTDLSGAILPKEPDRGETSNG